MSKLPKINQKATEDSMPYPQSSPLTAYTSEQHKNSQNDFPPIIRPYNTFSQNNKLSPFAFEAKLNEFESKMIALEHNNFTLMHRLQENERNFERQLQAMQTKADEERESRFKSDKAITFISENQGYSSSDIRNRLNSIQEMIEKDERWKIEQRNREMDMYKGLIAKVTEKVGAIVKIEVDARYKSDSEHKMLVNGLSSRFENEFEAMRKDLDEFMNAIRQEMNRSSKECSERADNVTKYFDQQLSTASGSNTESIQMRGFLHKLTDQMKTNLISQGAKNDSIEARLKTVEQYLPQMKDSFYQFISTVEERLVNIVKDIRVFSEMNIIKLNEDLSQQITGMGKGNDDTIQLLAHQLMETRNRMSLAIEDIARSNKDTLTVICEDLTSILNRVYLYEALIKEHEEKFTGIKDQVEAEANSIRVTYDVQAINERIFRAVENEEIKDSVRECIKALSSINSNFSDNMTEVNKNAELNFMGLLERVNYLQDAVGKIEEKSSEMIEEVKRSVDKVETKQMVNELLFKIEDEHIIDLLEQDRQFQLKTKEDFEALSATYNSSGGNMMEMMNEMKAIAKEKEAKDSINRTIENILNDVDLKAKDLYLTTQASQNEAALLNALTALDNRFQDHLNNNESEFGILRELIDDKAKGGSSSETEVKLALQQVINNAEFDNIYFELNKLSSMPPMTIEGNKPVGEVSVSQGNSVNEGVESMINGALERIKNDNVNMWVNAVELTQKFTQLEEIKKIITDVPPVITPGMESMKRIMDLNYNFNDNPHPVISSNKETNGNEPSQFYD